ncbi:uncharacterized protein MELLADRAFT_110684 [Melampsora larici-populina 98AG31]|uniref:Uncharacterized protein n=1 Tax=Melampsora larici-populina (strain 98AG31 / pathotype 3-4-7) TaxID=747676 RepID=F4S0L8_MELLP|nr:uncharacterized protein MELLADRAFT_110684 [Melampsora larici-populina 98AG31]EGG01846.1 hypothetical protein MELLADRAFT_110684 [Melampsora larici-populina 98AG31]
MPKSNLPRLCSDCVSSFVREFLIARDFFRSPIIGLGSGYSPSASESRSPIQANRTKNKENTTVARVAPNPQLPRSTKAQTQGKKKRTSNPKESRPLSLMSLPKALKSDVYSEKKAAHRNKGKVTPMGRGTPSEGDDYILILCRHFQIFNNHMGKIPQNMLYMTYECENSV